MRNVFIIRDEVVANGLYIDDEVNKALGHYIDNEIPAEYLKSLKKGKQ